MAVAHILKWKWGGHVARMDKRRRVQSTSVWDVRLGKTGNGRPKTQWADTFERATGKWSRRAKNRRNWRTHTHTTFVKVTSIGISRLAMKTL